VKLRLLRGAAGRVNKNMVAFRRSMKMAARKMDEAFHAEAEKVSEAFNRPIVVEAGLSAPSMGLAGKIEESHMEDGVRVIDKFTLDSVSIQKGVDFIMDAKVDEKVREEFLSEGEVGELGMDMSPSRCLDKVISEAPTFQSVSLVDEDQLLDEHCRIKEKDDGEEE